MLESPPISHLGGKTSVDILPSYIPAKVWKSIVNHLKSSNFSSSSMRSPSLSSLMPPESSRLPSTQAFTYERPKVVYEIGFIFNIRDPGPSSMVMSSVTSFVSFPNILRNKAKDINTEKSNENLAEEHH